jgi:predicted nucleic acid-binding protein
VIDVVVDTNVLVAAFRSSLGPRIVSCKQSKVLQTIEGRQWRPVVSPALALEYESVLKRGIGELGLNPGDVDDFIDYLCSRARLVQVYFRWRPMLPDPDDDRILEVAVRSGSPNRDVQRDFRGSESLHIRTMSPGELLAILGDQR